MTWESLSSGPFQIHFQRKVPFPQAEGRRSLQPSEQAVNLHFLHDRPLASVLIEAC